MQTSMNTDNYSATPTGPSSPFPTYCWTSNTYDILSLFTFPSGNQGQYTFATSSQNSKVSFNHILNSKTRDRKTTFRTQQILQFYMAVSEAFLWAKCSTEEVKFHLSHKNLIQCPIYQQNRWKFYGSYSSTRQLSDPSFKIGTLWSNIASKDFAELRLRFNKGKFNNDFYLYGKGGYIWNSAWNIGALVVLDLKKQQMQKNDVKVGWEIDNNNWVSLQLQTDGFRTEKLKLDNFFDLLRANYFYQFENNQWKAGLTYQHNLGTPKFNKAEALIDYSSSGKGLTNFKSKIEFINLNSKLAAQLAIAATYSHSSTLKAEVGIKLSQLESFNFRPNNFGANIIIGEI